MERARAEQVACPWCQQSPGQTCRNSVTGQLLKKVPAHWQRLYAVDHPGDVSVYETRRTQP
jgi:hypothetical protein